jgi:chromosome segregation ATPase
MNNPIIETDLKEYLQEFKQGFYQINQKLEKIDERLTKIEVGQAEIRGEIRTLDEKLSGQIETLNTKIQSVDERVKNQEFVNRGVLIGLIVAILGGAAKLFGLIPNP